MLDQEVSYLNSQVDLSSLWHMLGIQRCGGAINNQWVDGAIVNTHHLCNH